MTMTCSFSMSFNYLCTIRTDGNLYMRGNYSRLIKILMYLENNTVFGKVVCPSLGSLVGATTILFFHLFCPVRRLPALKEQLVLAMLVSNRWSDVVS